MRLRHAQRQLLARCSVRYYSVSAVSGKNSVSTPDAIAASGTSAPPRTRRPLASSLGGISIQNVVVPTQSQGFRSRTNRPSRADDSKSSDAPRTNKQGHQRATGKPGYARSDWGDGLVSLSFGSRLKMLEKKKMTPQQNTAAWPDDQARRHPRQRAQTQERQHDPDAESHAPRTRDRQNSARAAQTQGRHNDQGTESHAPHTRDRQYSARGGQARGRQQHDQGTESHSPRNRDRQNSTRAATQTSRQQPTSAGDDSARPAGSKMTRPRLSTHSQQAQKPTSESAPHQETPSSTTMKTRAAQLTVLSSTNLDALLQTRSTPMAVTLSSTHTTPAEHSLREREHRTGDYSRYLPHHVGLCKNAARPPVLRTAHLALARQRDVALEQRHFALRIIDGLAQPRRQVSA